MSAAAFRREYDERGALVASGDALYLGAVQTGDRRRAQIARDRQAGRRSRPATASEARGLAVLHGVELFADAHGRAPSADERAAILAGAGVGRRR